MSQTMRSRRPLRRGLAAVAATAAAATIAPAAAVAGTPAPGTAGATTTQADRSSSTTRVRLRVGTNRPEVVRTTRTWPGGLLRDEGVAKDGNDLVQVHRNGHLVRAQRNRDLHPGDTVKVVVVAKKVRRHRQRIENRTITRQVSRLKPGRRKVVARGRDGLRRVVLTEVRHNYETVGHHRRTKVLRQPRPRRVLVGRSARSVPGTGHLHWRALANCESGGNPRAVNPAGYYGLYQFSTGTWSSVGGHGLPSHASAGEQTYRAKLLYKRRGRSPWPNCGRLL